MAELTTNKIIAAVLVILVIAAVAMFLLKPDILDWVRQLPEYKYDEDKAIDISQLSDEEIAALHGERIGYIAQGYIYLDRNTGIYLSEPDIYLDDPRVDVGDIVNNRFVINRNLFNAKSEEFNMVRMGVVDRFWNDLVTLDNAKIAKGFGGLIIFKKPEDADPNLKAERPSNWGEEEIINLDNWNIKGIIWSTKVSRYYTKEYYYKQFYPPETKLDPNVFLYLTKEKDYVNIYRRTTKKFSWAYLVGRIYPDGSIWFDSPDLKATGLRVDIPRKEWKCPFSSCPTPQWESNLRIDYISVLKRMNEIEK